MNSGRWLSMALALVAQASTGAAQTSEVRRELEARGAPEAFVEMVVMRVDAAAKAGLPAGPIVDKAMEGWAKRIPAERVGGALDQVSTRLAAGRSAAATTSGAPPSPAVIVAAAEALGRGMTPEDVATLLASAPTPEASAAGLLVAAAMAAQGLDRAAAVRAVEDALRVGGDADQLYELPSAVADLTSHGIGMGELARRIMQGGGLPLPPTAGGGQGAGRPGDVPPGRGSQQGTGRQQRRK